MASGQKVLARQNSVSIETTSISLVELDLLVLLIPICDRKEFGAAALGIVKCRFLP